MSKPRRYFKSKETQERSAILQARRNKHKRKIARKQLERELITQIRERSAITKVAEAFSIEVLPTKKLEID